MNDDDNDVLEVAPHYRKALDFVRVMFSVELNATPGQKDDFFQMLAQIAFLCGEGHAVSEFLKMAKEGKNRDGLKRLLDAIDQNILDELELAQAFGRKLIRTPPVQPSGDKKSPWRM